MLPPEEIPLRTDITPKLYQNCGGATQEMEVQPHVMEGHSVRPSMESVSEGDWNSSIGTDPELHGYSLANKIFRTVAIDAAYFGAALNLGIIGPSLLDLRKLTNTTKSQISSIFTVRGVLAIIGSLAFGPILDYMDRYVAVGGSLIITSAFTIAAPWTQSLVGILLTLGPPEFFGCALGMGTHLICVEIWHGHAGPFLQLLNFVSVSGFAVAPLLVKPFLSEHLIEGNSFSTNEELNNFTKCGNHGDTFTKNSTFQNNRDFNIVNIAGTNMTANYLMVNCSGNYNPGIATETKIYITYLIVGLYCLFASILFLVIILSERRVKVVAVLEDLEEVPEKSPGHNYSQSQLYLLYFLFFLFIFLYGGIEVGYPSQVTTFAVEHLHMSKGDGAYLASVVMGSNAVFTALGILLVNLVRPNIIIWIDILGLTASLIILTLLVNSHPKIIWFCSFLLGATSASIMPCAYTWANDLFKVRGLFNSAFWCGFFSGFMVTPALAGFLMEYMEDNMWYLYIMLISSILVLLLFTLLSIVAARKNTTTPPPEVPSDNIPEQGTNI